MSLINNLAVITSYFNPCGYKNREKCFRRFRDSLRNQSIEPWIVEAIVPGGSYFVEESERVIRLEMPEGHWLWQKERLLNLLCRTLPSRIDAIAWVDCDITFQNESWPRLTVEALETWPVVQLFDFVFWRGPNDEILDWHGIADRCAGIACLMNHYPEKAGNFRMGTPGFAWAARREILTRFGIFDTDVTGSSDSIFACALYGWKRVTPAKIGTEGMIRDAYRYIDHLYPSVRGYVGYIPARIDHLWHGSWANREYIKRRQGLGELGFDPFRDLETCPDSGLLRWSALASEALKEFVHQYFYRRREDDELSADST